MTNSSYKLQTDQSWDGTLGLLDHYPATQFFVRDADDADDADARMHMRARVRSGDYLLTLATELDKIAQSLASVKAPEAPELERIVSELISIGQDYTVSKK